MYFYSVPVDVAAFLESLTGRSSLGDSLTSCQVHQADFAHFLPRVLTSQHKPLCQCIAQETHTCAGSVALVNFMQIYVQRCVHSTREPQGNSLFSSELFSMKSQSSNISTWAHMWTRRICMCTIVTKFQSSAKPAWPLKNVHLFASLHWLCMYLCHTFVVNAE